MRDLWVDEAVSYQGRIDALVNSYLLSPYSQLSDDARGDAYRSEPARWAAEESAEAAYESPPLWAFLAERGASLPDPQRRFVEAWSERISSSGASAVPDDPFLRNLIEQRELKLKGRRARLANANRLLDWSGSVGVGRMGFRWFRVRQLLTDLHGGLKS